MSFVAAEVGSGLNLDSLNSSFVFWVYCSKSAFPSSSCSESTRYRAASGLSLHMRQEQYRSPFHWSFQNQVCSLDLWPPGHQQESRPKHHRFIPLISSTSEESFCFLDASKSLQYFLAWRTFCFWGIDAISNCCRCRSRTEASRCRHLGQRSMLHSKSYKSNFDGRRPWWPCWRCSHRLTISGVTRGSPAYVQMSTVCPLARFSR